MYKRFTVHVLPCLLLPYNLSREKYPVYSSSCLLSHTAGAQTVLGPVLEGMLQHRLKCVLKLIDSKVLLLAVPPHLTVWPCRHEGGLRGGCSRRCRGCGRCPRASWLLAVWAPLLPSAALTPARPRPAIKGALRAGAVGAPGSSGSCSEGCPLGSGRWGDLLDSPRTRTPPGCDSRTGVPLTWRRVSDPFGPLRWEIVLCVSEGLSSSKSVLWSWGICCAAILSRLTSSRAGILAGRVPRTLACGTSPARFSIAAAAAVGFAGVSAADGEAGLCLLSVQGCDIWLGAFLVSHSKEQVSSEVVRSLMSRCGFAPHPSLHPPAPPRPLTRHPGASQLLFAPAPSSW